ncbi:MAG: 3-methyl-2-oxobutanoate hydroxymethyltransferase [Kiritimatiellia bacterium]
MKWTATRIQACKGREKVACLTAADFAVARLMDQSGVPLILVGDSLGMTTLGYDTTLPVTIEDMLHHTAAVVRGVREALVIADMPFMTYQVSAAQALKNAGRLVQEAGADGVKIEGGAIRARTVSRLVANGIPVLGHLGLTPQSVRAMGGYKVQGRMPDEAQQLLVDAQKLEAAGVFAIVLECIPEKLARAVTDAVGVPTIGIGAGRYCDGQILVASDLLGIETGVSTKFTKRYAELGKAMSAAFRAYVQEVGNGAFPSKEHTFS